MSLPGGGVHMSELTPRAAVLQTHRTKHAMPRMCMAVCVNPCLELTLVAPRAQVSLVHLL